MQDAGKAAGVRNSYPRGRRGGGRAGAFSLNRLFEPDWCEQMAIRLGAPAEAAGAASSDGGNRLLPRFLATPMGRIAAGIALLGALRVVLGAVLPLSFDEAYYWLWSRHLAAGYFDHPPAIAFAIRLGTALVGDSAFAVRLVPLLASFAASWAVWRSADILLEDKRQAALACLYFNLTLMVAAETMAATPDAMALAASAFVLWALAKLIESGEGRWWLAVGAFGGLCLLSKYTGFFLGAGVLAWLIAMPQGRRWLASPWPYAGAILALAIFAPVIGWNAAHDWASFRFQFGRVESGGLAPRFLVEFALGQLALASPFILVLGAAGFVRASRIGAAARPVGLAAALIWPAAAYFVVHATHDRVQGNWPSFVYPPFALLAAFAAAEEWPGRIAGPVLAAARKLAVPTAALILALVYAQAFFAVVPSRDPVARLTAVGFAPVARAIERLARDEGALGVATTSYATTSWLAFYLKPGLPVIQLNESYRWLDAPAPDACVAQGTLIFVMLHPKTGGLPAVVNNFARVRFLAQIERRRRGALIERYDVYRVSGWRGAFPGRAP